MIKNNKTLVAFRTSECVQLFLSSHLSVFLIAMKLIQALILSTMVDEAAVKATLPSSSLPRQIKNSTLNRDHEGRIESATDNQRDGVQRVQLHRGISKLGMCSRKQAWGAVVSGRVRIDGEADRSSVSSKGEVDWAEPDCLNYTTL